MNRHPDPTHDKSHPTPPTSPRLRRLLPTLARTLRIYRLLENPTSYTLIEALQQILQDLT